MRIAITGPAGFVAWHTRCAMRARWGGDAIHIGRAEFDDPQSMDRALEQTDVVVHLAGVNRAARDDQTVREVNPWLARRLVEGIDRANRPIPVVYGNSVHANGNTEFGQAKAEAASLLEAWGGRSGAPIANVVLPNIFGEHGKPHYNSVVATFCNLIVRGEEPELIDDKVLDLLHVQDAATILLDLANSPENGRFDPQGTRKWVSEVLTELQQISAEYRTGDLPDLSSSFTRDLFNTYRSFTFPGQYPIFPPVRGDQRGELFESVRALGGQTQVFFSTTRPGLTRGQHYHLRKVERFLVLRGTGSMRLRKLFSDEIVEFEVSGERPAIVDMPTMWIHSITNTGDDELVTLFYADSVFDPLNPDTYQEVV